MAQSRYKRKLTAILSADVVGYSRLMGDDEEFTIQTLNSHRDIMTALIEQYRGSVVDAVGDNLLAEFASAADAVQCATAVQVKLKKQNDNLPAECRMHFRIGINIGDIVHENNRIYGDGVNIAARIESLADPGGICISRNIYNHIKKQLDFEYDYMGEHSVKNIADPVKVYKVIMDPKDAKTIERKSGHAVKKVQLKKRITITAIIVFILIAVPSGLYWKSNSITTPDAVDSEGKPQPVVDSQEKPVQTADAPEDEFEFNLPEGPSIAVLPFDNMSKDPEQEYFCDGITENIISSLAKVPQLLVIARNSTFAYKDKSINVQQIGRELNVKYLIEGSIQKSDDKFRITVQLIDADSGHHIWSESYDRTFKDILKLQDEITLEILKAVGIKLTSPWVEAGMMEGIADINNFIMYQKLLEYANNPTRDKYSWALKNVKELIISNTEHRYRYNFLAMVYMAGAMIGSCESSEICLLKAEDAIKQSFSLDADYWWTYQQSGFLLMLRKEYDKAILKYKKALERNPNSASIHAHIGSALNFFNKPMEALEYLNKAIRLNPVSNIFYWAQLGFSYRLLEKYEKAIKMYKKSLKHEPNYWPTYIGLTISYSLSGEEDMAKASVKSLLNLFPGYSIEYLKKHPPYKDPGQIERAVKALRRAGLPETSQ